VTMNPVPVLNPVSPDGVAEYRDGGHGSCSSLL